MPAPPSDPQATQAVITVLVVIVAGCCVVYWRTALRVILILVLVLAVYGTVIGIHAVSSLMTVHHQ